MPVVVTFNLPVTDRALFEKHMEVTSTPAQRGSWYWLSDREAHVRPVTWRHTPSLPPRVAAHNMATAESGGTQHRYRREWRHTTSLMVVRVSHAATVNDQR